MWIIWQTVRRITKEILEVKGLKYLASPMLEPHLLHEDPTNIGYIMQLPAHRTWLLLAATCRGIRQFLSLALTSPALLINALTHSCKQRVYPFNWKSLSFEPDKLTKTFVSSNRARRFPSQPSIDVFSYSLTLASHCFFAVPKEKLDFVYLICLLAMTLRAMLLLDESG